MPAVVKLIPASGQMVAIKLLLKIPTVYAQRLHKKTTCKVITTALSCAKRLGFVYILKFCGIGQVD
jgi:hypothetical protein